MPDDTKAPDPKEWGGALSELSSAAMMWGEAKVALFRATQAEAEAKLRFLNAMSAADRLVRPAR